MNVLSADRLFTAMNELGSQKEPFVFLTDAFAEKGIVERLDQSEKTMWFKSRGCRNTEPALVSNPLTRWDIFPVSFEKYNFGFGLVMEHVRRGDTFLLNYTQATDRKSVV